MEQVIPAEVVSAEVASSTVAQPPKYTAVDAWMSVHTSKPYTSCMAQRILAQVEQNAAELAAEVLYCSGARRWKPARPWGPGKSHFSFKGYPSLMEVDATPPVVVDVDAGPEIDIGAPADQVFPVPRSRRGGKPDQGLLESGEYSSRLKTIQV